ncbi:hypothetical protein ACLMJK_008370 [Lecanora helva]
MLKKTVHRPNHRERAQPAGREKWGLLEKHKDYSLRARDFQEKKKRLKILRQKAAERNPDEFRYGMLSSRSKQGKKISERGIPVLSNEVVKILKTQDAGYVRTMLQQTRRAIEKLEQEFSYEAGEGAKVLGGLEDEEKGRHVIFVKDKKEQKSYVPWETPNAKAQHTDSAKVSSISFEEDEDEDKAKELDLGESKVWRKVTRANQHELEATKQDKAARKKHRKENNARQAKLLALRARVKDLVLAESELELQRTKMTNSIGGVTKAGIKWKPRERKK